MDEKQWLAIYTEKEIEDIFESAFKTISAAPVVKAAAIKLFGFVIYLPHFNQRQELVDRALEFFYANSSDTNTNVMIRTSWALANVASITKSFTEEPQKHVKLVQICLNCLVSSKEKIISNGIRAFG